MTFLRFARICFPLIGGLHISRNVNLTFPLHTFLIVRPKCILLFDYLMGIYFLPSPIFTLLCFALTDSATLQTDLDSLRSTAWSNRWLLATKIQCKQMQAHAYHKFPTEYYTEEDAGGKVNGKKT